MENTMSSVLVISPERAFHKTLRTHLGDQYAILEARSPEEAMTLALHCPIDVVLMEPLFPDTDLRAFIQRLKHVREETCLVLLGDLSAPDYLEESNAEFQVEVVSKPIEVREVKRAIRRALERVRLSREVRMLKTRVEANGAARLLPGASMEQAAISTNFPGWFSSKRDPGFPQYALKELFRALTHITELEKLLDFLLHALCDMFQVNKACILLPEPSRFIFRPRAWVGLEESRLRNIALRLDGGLPGWLLRFNQIVKKEEVDLSGFTREGALVASQMESLDAKIGAPLFTKGRLVGILTLGNKVTGRPFTDFDVEQLSMLTNYAAVAVENSLLYRELYLQKRYNENILRSIGSGVVAIDHLGKVTTYNPGAERLLGVPKEEVLGKSVQKLGSIFADLLLRTLDGTENFNRHEVTHPLTKAPLGVSTSPLRDEANRIRGAVMIFTDLTESKELEARTRDLERLRFWSTLANRMAQEIRNPLVAVKTFAQLLPERYQDKDFREEFFSLVMAEIDRLTQITERLLEFAMPRDINPSRQDLNQIVESAIAAKMAWIKDKGLRLVTHLSTDPIYVNLDGGQMEKALSHILDNAVEATSEGGKVRIRTQRVREPCPDRSRVLHSDSTSYKPWAEILIEDTGCGIAPEHLTEIFSPFFTTKVKGMGFGLPIARRIIQDHGGKIEVESDRGKGTKVRIFLAVDNNAVPIRENLRGV